MLRAAVYWDMESSAVADAVVLCAGYVQRW